MELLLIVLLTLLNGVFAMSELALASSRKARLNAMRDSGKSGAEAALQLMEQPTQFLSTVQMGVTSIGLLNGIVGEAAFSGPLADRLIGLGVGETLAPIAATAMVVLVITFTTIVFGELVPKRIGQMYPETVSRWVAAPMAWLARMTKPFIWLLSASTKAMLKLLRIDDSHSRPVTEEEISASLVEGVDAGLIEAQEHLMVRNVFHLDDRSLSSLMVPHAEIEWLKADLNAVQALDYVASRGETWAHSWYPVCEDGLDTVIGMISVPRLLELRTRTDIELRDHVSPVEFIPETLSAMEMLEQLRNKSGRLSLVVDEYGIVQGLLTPRDLLEAITGELKASVELDAWAIQGPDGSWRLDGLIPASELKARLDIASLPLEDKGRYHTLAGLLMAILGRLPMVGEQIDCAGWVFTIRHMEGRRIDQVLAERMTVE